MTTRKGISLKILVATGIVVLIATVGYANFWPMDEISTRVITSSTGIEREVPSTGITPNQQKEADLAEGSTHKPSNIRNEVTLSGEMIQKIGVRTVSVVNERLEHSVRATGRFVMDEESRYVVSLKVGGWIEKLWANSNGKIVTKGSKLFELFSPELITTQDEFLLALKSVNRLQNGSDRAKNDADELLEAARERLKYWGMTTEQIRNLEQTGKTEKTLTFLAPASGEVMLKSIAEGQHISAGESLMEIADISTVWLVVDVHEKDLAWIKKGGSVATTLPSHPEKEYFGQIDFIYHMMDAEARTAKARIVFPGSHGSPLKPGAYATAYLRGSPQALLPVIPEEAVIRTGERQIVIQQVGEGRFSLQEVITGLSSNGRVQIIEGLKSGDKVVSSGHFMIDSEARLLGISPVPLFQREK